MVRFKNRYLLVEILLADEQGGFSGRIPPSFHEGAIVSIIRESVLVNFGEVGSAEIGGALTIKYFSPATRLAIIRVARSAHQTVWAALTFVRQIKGMDCCIRVLHVGGTIRKTQQEAIRHDRRLIFAPAGATDLLPTDLTDESVLKRIDESREAIMATEA